MKIFKPFFLAILGVTILTSSRSFGQSSVEPVAYTQPYTHLPTMGVPSPNAASLGTYANFPTQNFTGVPEINIPLYEINEQGFKLPISISYNVNGIKVNDIGSWVGLGFSLNAGGVVTRNVVGSPDDENDYIPVGGTMDNPSPPMGHQGFLYRNYNGKTSDIENYWDNTPTAPLGYPAFNINGRYQGLSLMSLRYNLVDTEPDIFSYNFNGHAGKFVFSQGLDYFNIGYVAPDQHKVSLVPYADLQVNYQFRGTEDAHLPSGNSQWIKSFTITDEDGNQYLFDQAEYQNTQVTDYAFYNRAINSGYGSSGSDYFSSWYLSKITTKLGKIINFNYVTEQQEQDLPTAFKARAFNVPGYPTESSYCYTNNYIKGLRLVSIEGDDYKLYFDADQARQDTKTNALTSIRIFSKDALGNQTPIKEFDFSYFYLQSPNVPANNDVTNGDTYQRLMLDNIVEKGADGTTTKPPYKFSYNNNTPLPNRFSAEQDFWGYYNQNGSTSKIPTVYVYPNLTGKDRYCIFPIVGSSSPYFTITGANRNTNTNVVTSGSLSQITYPTGGTTTFQFESNKFFYNNQTITGGGLRINQITNYDGVSHSNDIIKQFNYSQTLNPTLTSGVLFNLPVYAYAVNFLDYWDQATGSGPGISTEFDPTTIDYYNHNLVIGDIPQFTMSGFDGINVGYSEITEINNNNGKTVNAYSTPGRYGDLSDQPANCDPAVEGYCDGLFAVPTASKWANVPLKCPGGTVDPLQVAPDLTGMDMGSNYSSPYAPTLNYDWNRGLLMSSIVYNQSGGKVSEEHNTYTVYSPQNIGPVYVLGLRSQLFENYVLYHSSCQNIYGLAAYDCFSQYKIITGVTKKLLSNTTTIFDSMNSGASTQKVTTYTYSPNCLSPNIIETTTSNGEVIDKHFTYPLDYSNLSSAASNTNSLGLYNMQKNHVVDPVVEEYSLRKKADGTNPRVTESYLTTFKSNQPLPDIVYRSESVIPISSFTTANITNTTITYDPSDKPFLSFDSYNSLGKILQQHKVGDPNSSYIWDYNNQYLIAKVTNAALSDIAYTSFEADGSGGWNLTPSAIVNDPSSPTGSKCYNLSSAIINDNNLNTGKSYIVSYWIKNQTTALGLTNGSTNLTSNTVVQGPTINGWTYFQHTISGTTAVQFVGSCLIDEVRLYPVESEMITYTYIPSFGMTSSADAKGMINYYEYDTFQRLLDIKDQYGNIIKSFCYNYAGQSYGCNVVPYVTTYPFVLTNSTGISGFVARFSAGSTVYNFNFLASGSTTVQIPAGTYQLTINPINAPTNRKFMLGSRAAVTAPGTTFNSVVVSSTSTESPLIIQNP